MRVSLTVTEGPHKGRVFTFGEHDTFVVGRSARAQLQLSQDDKYFSRNHFMVEVNPPHCRLMDLGSRNGTFINGTRTELADLRDGDVIKVGRTVLQASIEHTGDTAEAVDGPPTNVGPYATVYPDQTADGLGTPADPIVLTEADVVADTQSMRGRAPATGTGSPASLCPACGAPAHRDMKSTARAALCADCESAARGRAQTIAGYRVVRELGRGAMGVVCLAVRAADGATVALKTITPACAASPADVKRFLREARILGQLEHPHIVAFRDMGESRGCFFFTMDYVRGTDAARLLKRHKGGLPIGRAVGIACQLLDAVAYAHAKKFVHRDIKPSNLLVAEVHDEAGNTRDVVKVADFGLARVYHRATFSGLTMQGDFGGTYPFMPPEQITAYKEARPTNDQYSVGATLYNLLTGRYVYDFPATLERSVVKLLQEDPVPIQTRRPDIPAALAAVVHRALAREPADRHDSVRAMADALGPFRTPT